jgi:hypothetical protein
MVKRPKLKRRLRKAKQAVPEVLVEKAASLKPIDTSANQPVRMEDVPKITTESIAEHREEVLKGARKYIYPLQHSKRTIIAVTGTVIAAAIIALFVYCSLALYKFYQYNTFVYRVTQVIPFPIAKAGNSYVSYESYLFELRHNVHYNETQQQRNFAGPDHDQLITLRKQALATAVNEAYIKQLAAQNHAGVSNKEVNNRLNQVRAQNRLGDNDKVFQDILKSYWGWSINDFKRSLKQEILAEKLAAALDKSANQRANSALAQLKSGLYYMKVGQTSNVILASPVLANQGPSLQIVKLTAINGSAVSAQHMVFNLQDISGSVNHLKKQQPVHDYVHF